MDGRIIFKKYQSSDNVLNGTVTSASEKGLLSRVLWYCYELAKNQWLTPAEIRRLQEKRLRAILKHAYANVPLYRDKLDSVGIKPSDIKSIEDLTKLPFTKKDEVRDGIPDRSIARGYDIDECVWMSTSGTSGGPMPVFYDKRYWDYCVALRHFRRATMLGFAPWERTMVIEYNRPQLDMVHHGNVKTSEVKRKSRSEEALGPSASLFSNRLKKVYIAYGAEEIIPDIIRYQPKIIRSNPSYLRLLVEVITEKGIQDVHPNFIVSHAEVLDEPTRKFLESSFGCGVYDGYGANEMGSISWECSMREGLHVMEDFFILEVVRDGEHVGAGERGEITITGLLNYAMPLIRYRFGDMGILGEERCSCGRGFTLLKSMEGRMVDCFILPKGRVVTPKIIQTVIQGTPGVSRYQAVQQSERKVTIELMRKESDPEVSVNGLITRCRDVLGGDVDIEVFIGDRKNLKAKFRPVISKLTVSGETRWTRPRTSSGPE